MCCCSRRLKNGFFLQVCESYPALVVVPKTVSDSVLQASASFREAHRFPVLSYVHENKAAMMRCGQPLVGPNNRRSRDDEQLLLAAIKNGKRAFIFETRSIVTAGAAKNRGKHLGSRIAQYRTAFVLSFCYW